MQSDPDERAELQNVITHLEDISMYPWLAQDVVDRIDAALVLLREAVSFCEV